MGTDKRERQKAQRAARMEAEAIQEKRSRTVRTGIRVAIVVGLVVVGAFVFSLVRGGGDDEEPAAEEDATDETEAPECPPEEGAGTRETVFSGPPPVCIDPTAGYVATVTTSRGEFEITLDPAQAPQTVNNFVFLARWKYYEGLPFHRIIPDFVVQGGDAGETSPGYQMGEIEGFDGELPTEEPYYPLMSVVMANQADPTTQEGDPGTNTSQFFVVVGQQGQDLPPQYTRFGEVTAGQDVVEAIAATGSADGTPSEETTIESATIAEQPVQGAGSTTTTAPAASTTTTAPAG